MNKNFAMQQAGTSPMNSGKIQLEVSEILVYLILPYLVKTL